jgi:hypothetical protein
MSTCILNKGVILDCREGQGGIKDIYLASYSATTTFAVNATGVITGATSANTFYKFEFPSEVTDVIETGNFSKENQTTFFEQVVNSMLYKTDQITRDTLNLLAMGRLFCITKDNSGQYILLGKENGMWMTTAAINSGKAYGDLNGISYSLTGREPYAGTEVAAAYIATLGV